jgi:hypothetical protein
MQWAPVGFSSGPSAAFARRRYACGRPPFSGRTTCRHGWGSARCPWPCERKAYRSGSWPRSVSADAQQQEARVLQKFCDFEFAKVVTPHDALARACAYWCNYCGWLTTGHPQSATAETLPHAETRPPGSGDRPPAAYKFRSGFHLAPPSTQLHLDAAQKPSRASFESNQVERAPLGFVHHLTTPSHFLKQSSSVVRSSGLGFP